MKRVLIVSYCFPPVTNMGSHRIRRFVRHLPEFGWEPVVLTAPGAQETPGAEIHPVPGVDLTALWRKFKRRPSGGGSGQTVTTSLNRWVMIPDKFFPWIKPAARAGAALKNIDAIYSTSDPLSDHLVALRISRKTGVPFVAEFRDLWLGNPYFARAHPTPLHRALHARLERRVVNGAAEVVGLSQGIADYFRRNYAKPVSVIYNCFDPEDYTGARIPSEKFSVLYAGAVYSSRSPESFFAGFAQFVRRRGLSPEQAEVIWLGDSPDLDLQGMAAHTGVAAFVRFGGRVTHAAALQRMQEASVLLTIQSPEDNIHVPGKLFEYVGAHRPILALAQPCEVADLVRQHALGWVCEPRADAVADTLGKIFSQPAPLSRVDIEQFSVTGTTRVLAGLLNRISK